MRENFTNEGSGTEPNSLFKVKELYKGEIYAINTPALFPFPQPHTSISFIV